MSFGRCRKFPAANERLVSWCPDVGWPDRGSRRCWAAMQQSRRARDQLARRCGRPVQKARRRWDGCGQRRGSTERREDKRSPQWASKARLGSREGSRCRKPARSSSDFGVVGRAALICKPTGHKSRYGRKGVGWQGALGRLEEIGSGRQSNEKSDGLGSLPLALTHVTLATS